nr:alpha/beta fold hydrolase [Kibdelosporangium sp. MJ126-NF4]CEL23117.1 putative proteinase [Kibdelosporangium sp. MJ126-NF4]CTQ90254.1 putative proteinase [Kibdelosporangium sp. MJ126-NF4]
MHSGTRSVVALVLAASAIGALVVGCGQGTPTAESPANVDTGKWCPTVQGHAVDCGTVRRQLVEGKPELGTIDVGYALVRRTRTDTPAAGTLMPNPGGPGVPLVAHAAEAAAISAGLSDDHDVLLIDPRGTGVSSPLDCEANEAEHQTGTREQQRQMAARCAERLGPKAAGYTSVATVDDFDAVRAKLGIDKVVPYGISYGTYLLPIYAQRHPEHVQSMVLTGAYPHDFDRLQRPNAEAVSLALQRICERSRECDGTTAVADLKTTAQRLRTQPITVDGKRPIVLDEAKLATLVFEAATSGVGTRPEEMTPLGMLPAALHKAVRGDDGSLREFVKLATDEPGYENIGVYIAVACNDYAQLWSQDADPAERERQYRDALAKGAPNGLGAFSTEGFSAGQRDGGDACIRWPGISGHQRPDQVTTPMPDVPVLVLSGDLDAITPDANGQRVAARFPRSTFISVPNTGHVPDLEPSGCVVGIVSQFVRTGGTGDTACVPRVPPVAVAPVTT